jgi:hypothetical protein
MSDIDPQDAIGLLRSFAAHRAHLAEGIGLIVAVLERRAAVHDLSKLGDDEFAGFARINATARINKFGSPEYKAGMDRERPTIDLHFSRNRHHPERPTLLGEAAEKERGLPDDCTYWTAREDATMTALDVIEMVCDWWAARKGYANDSRTWRESAAQNMEQKGQYLNEGQTWLVWEIVALLESLES